MWWMRMLTRGKVVSFKVTFEGVKLWWYSSSNRYKYITRIGLYGSRFGSSKWESTTSLQTQAYSHGGTKGNSPPRVKDWQSTKKWDQIDKRELNEILLITTSDAFCGLVLVQNGCICRRDSRTPLGELSTPPDPLAGGEEARGSFPKHSSHTLGLRPRILSLYTPGVPSPRQIYGYTPMRPKTVFVLEHAWGTGYRGTN